MSAEPRAEQWLAMLELVREYGDAAAEYAFHRGNGCIPTRLLDMARERLVMAGSALRGAILDAAGDPVGDTVRGEPKTSRGKQIVDAAREMADAQERAAVSYEHGSALGRAQGDSDAAGARSEIERLVADFEDALSAAEERARRAEAERDEWRAVAEEGARLVSAQHIDPAMAWAASVHYSSAAYAVYVDPAAGTGAREREPGRMGE